MNQELFFRGSSSTSRSSKMVKVNLVFSCISLILVIKFIIILKSQKRTLICNANKIYISN